MDELDRMCADCGCIVGDPEELIGGRCQECADAERKLAGRHRQTSYAVSDNSFRGYAFDEYMTGRYGLAMGLARDDERQRRGNHG